MCDLEKMELHLKSLECNKEIISWILENQSRLREELLSFYKNEFKEIDASLVSIDMGEEKLSFRLKLLESIQNVFLAQWQRSYDLVLPQEFSGTAGFKPENVRILKNKPHTAIPLQQSLANGG